MSIERTDSAASAVTFTEEGLRALQADPTAANPQTVLSLLARLRSADAVITKARGHALVHLPCQLREAIAAYDALVANAEENGKT